MNEKNKSTAKKKKKWSWEDIKRQIASTSNKDKVFAGICLAFAVGLSIWFVFDLLM